MTGKIIHFQNNWLNAPSCSKIWVKYKATLIWAIVIQETYRNSNHFT